MEDEFIFVPMPNTNSESMFKFKERALGSPFPQVVVFLEPDNLFRDIDRYAIIKPIPKIILERKTGRGPAPFVGDYRHEEASYFWEYYIDRTGSHFVSGEAHLRYHPIFPALRLQVT